MPGYVIFDGSSRIDGAPIIVIATTETSNRKTGDMVQTWILRADIDPLEASCTAKDFSICGNCAQRWAIGGACYVNIGQAPLSIWRAWSRGAYPTANAADIGRGRFVRIGAYGDPYAVSDFSVWSELTSECVGYTGYTHQWIRNDAKPLMQFCMASVDSILAQHVARSMGYRTFRVTNKTFRSAREFECPSEHGTQCVECLACDGTDDKGAAKASPVIFVHGSRASRF